jgi:hypothetical protein
MNYPKFYIFSPSNEFVRFRRLGQKQNDFVCRLDEQDLMYFVDVNNHCDWDYFQDGCGLVWYYNVDGSEELDVIADFEWSPLKTIVCIQHYSTYLNPRELYGVRSMFLPFYGLSNQVTRITREMQRLLDIGVFSGPTKLLDTDKTVYDAPVGDVDLLLNFSQAFPDFT